MACFSYCSYSSGHFRMLAPEFTGAHLLSFRHAFTSRLLHPTSLIRMYSAFLNAGIKGPTNTANVGDKRGLSWNHFTSNCEIQGFYLAEEFVTIFSVINSFNGLDKLPIYSYRLSLCQDCESYQATHYDHTKTDLSAQDYFL